MAEAKPPLPLNVEYLSGEALIGLSGAVLTKDEEQRFLECDRQLMLVHFRCVRSTICSNLLCAEPEPSLQHFLASASSAAHACRARERARERENARACNTSQTMRVRAPRWVVTQCGK